MNFSAKKKSAFILLALTMFLFFNAPVLSGANMLVFFGGMPLLYLYLFLSWTIMIIFLMITSMGRRKNNKTDE